MDKYCKPLIINSMEPNGLIPLAAAIAGMGVAELAVVGAVAGLAAGGGMGGGHDSYYRNIASLQDRDNSL